MTKEKINFTHLILFRSGVRATDDGHGNFLPGKTAGASILFGVQGGYGVGVTSSQFTHASRGGKVRVTTLGDHGPQWGATHL